MQGTKFCLFFLAYNHNRITITASLTSLDQILIWACRVANWEKQNKRKIRHSL